ncbi:MAG: transketolase [Azonexus sp.]
MTTTTETVTELKRVILLAAHQAGEGHIASAFSILDALYVLYQAHVNINPQEPKNPDRDYVILSKGHGCLALYAILAKHGFFSFAELSTFCKFGSMFGGHPHRCKVPGIEASTGSLGHGLPMAVGIAKALKMRGKTNKVYCIVGDGEMNEGSNWESLLIAEHHHLDNLVILVDYNHSNDRAIAYSGPFKSNLHDKLLAFGLTVASIDGHNHYFIDNALSSQSVPGTPYCIVLNTVKGKGIKEMENNPAWHHRAPNAEELTRFLEELK